MVSRNPAHTPQASFTSPISEASIPTHVDSTSEGVHHGLDETVPAASRGIDPGGNEAEDSRGETEPDPEVITSALAVETAVPTGFYLRYGKRALDIVVSGTLLLLLGPLFVAIALAVRIDSPGSAIYRCRRVGHRGVPFSFWKFRSMVTDAEEDKCKLLHMNEVDGPVFKVADDPRMTRVGRFLRRSSLDELPQLVHVFRGQMTLVGPRPPEAEEVEQYDPWQLRRLSVPPGLTCLWQISGRSLIGFQEWMRLDLEYVDNRSFRLDMAILFRTIPAVLSGRGAF